MKALLTWLVLLFPSISFAHSGVFHSEFLALIHPFTGIDHVATILLLSCIAAYIGKPKEVAMAVSICMFISAVLGDSLFISLQLLEILIISGFLALGILIISIGRTDVSAVIRNLVIIFCASIHGAVHGIELSDTGILSYALLASSTGLVTYFIASKLLLIQRFRSSSDLAGSYAIFLGVTGFFLMG